MKNLFLFFAVLLAANLSQAQWEADVRLTNNPGDANTSYNNAWCIATSGDTIHVVWFDDRNGNTEIYYIRSTDGGLTWGSETRLTNASGYSYAPSIVVSGSVVHVVWGDTRDASATAEIYYKQSHDAGTTWGADTRLTNAPYYSEFPSMAISGSVLHVVWTDYRDQNGDMENYYKRSTDGGLTWEPDTRLTNDPGYSGFPCVAVSGSVVHVLWEDNRDGNGEIYYKRSADGGITWGAETRLTNNPADQWDPCVAVNDSVVHVVWMDARDGSTYEIYYKRSNDGGLTWGSDTRLTNATGDSEYPNIAASGSNVHVVWQDKRDVNQEIYYKQSTDGGITWGADIRLTNAVSTSQHPSVSISGSIIHVVWYDNRNGNEEIYYKRNPTGNIPVGVGDDLMNEARQHISIWPNPVSDKVNISLTSVQNGIIFASIYNVLGEKVICQELPNAEMSIDVSGLQNGIYFVGVTLDKRQLINKKLIISK